MFKRACLLITSVLALLPRSAIAQNTRTTISAAIFEQGVLVHDVECPYQAGKTQILIVLPHVIPANRKYPVIYVVPVEAQRESRYGDGVREIKANNLHDKHQAIFVAPTFSHLPWYADHPTEPSIRQETYLL